MSTALLTWGELRTPFLQLASELTPKQARAEYQRTPDGWYTWLLLDMPQVQEMEFRRLAAIGGRKMLDTPGALTAKEREDFAKLDAFDRWMAYLHRCRRPVDTADMDKEPEGNWEIDVLDQPGMTTGQIGDVVRFSAALCGTLSENETDHKQPPRKQTTTGRKRRTKAKGSRKLDVAKAIKTQNPELSPADVAKKARCSRSYLSRNKEYRKWARTVEEVATSAGTNAAKPTQSQYDARTGELQLVDDHDHVAEVDERLDSES